jgi:hypothetical protein
VTFKVLTGEQGNLHSVQRLSTGRTAEESEFDFLFTSSRTVLRPASYPMGNGDSSPGVKRGQEYVDLYIHFSIRLHGAVFGKGGICRRFQYLGYVSVKKW